MGLCRRSISVKDRGIAQIGRKPWAVRSFEVCGSFPVPYDEGIADFAAFTKDAGERGYEQFLKEFCPDVIHIHTFMCLHGSFLWIAGKMKIRRVFTAHDYFPICPKVTMIRHGQICTAAESCTGSFHKSD